MLFFGSNHITFDVSVTGTSSIPAVRCIIGSEEAQMFTAKNVSGTTWEAEIIVPTEITQIAFRIEVQLNGRIFTPINTVFDVSHPATVSPVEVDNPEYAVPKEPKVIQQTLVQPTSVIKPAPGVRSLMQSFNEIIQPPASKKAKALIPKAKNTINLESLAKKSVTKKAIVVKPVSTSLLDIASLHEVANPNQKGTVIPTAVQSSIPVTLKKGEVKYL